jgi:3-isopropylmalate/(R)-2-methylmalate dehydratase small subunit
MRWGIDGLIGESFAEIFMGNCQALGMPTATADAEVVAWLMGHVEAHPDAAITLDVEAEIATVSDRTLPIAINDSQREALLNGIWDTTALMKSYLDDVQLTAEQLPYLNGFVKRNA